ncbi:MAG: DUF4342 domain-containing protein [[Eubacterium] brachy]|jgi:hypothetical protein|nr:UBA/TS-N domain protein [Eubacterium brachy ATCC 33089]MBF1133771.1 DUF4342 domain-containing protein [[Eubacterium] brachy]
MEITLEKIELVKDRTGVSYKEAKEALETANGSVVDAIISIEESIDESQRNSLGDQSTALIDKIKELVKRGNVARIQVKNPDGETVLNIPVNAGIAGAVVAPWGMLIGGIAAFGFKYVIEVIRDDGTVIDISDRTNDAVEKATEKGTEMYEKVIHSDAYEKVKGKTEETLGKATEALKNKFSKNDSDDVTEFAEDFDVKNFEEDEE